jgi:hypothetical protein
MLFSVKSTALSIVAVLGTQIHSVVAVCAGGQMGKCRSFECVIRFVD